jgi:hypothetical protein
VGLPDFEEQLVSDGRRRPPTGRRMATMMWAGWWSEGKGGFGLSFRRGAMVGSLRESGAKDNNFAFFCLPVSGDSVYNKASL